MFIDSLKKNKYLFFGGLVVALVLIVTGVIIYTNNNANNTANTPALNTYTASKNYEAPGNVAKELDLSVTLNGDTITDLTVKDLASDGTSSKYESDFSKAIKERVVGKSIKSQFDTSTVNGSSLTSAAFFSAFAEIQAKVK